MSNTLSVTDQHVPVRVADRDYRIECRLIAAEKTDRPLVIFLHEGLGSVALWRDWPAQFCEQADCRGLVYSRYGYGSSTPRPADEKWPLSYMHDHAREHLPAILQALGLQNELPVLFGHSDGASIALLYAAMHPKHTGAVAVAAPHIFVEDITIESIAKAREAYLNTDLPQKFSRYHTDPDSAFWGWNDAWLNPEFKNWNIEAYLSDIQCPVLAIQGTDDEYGTLAQIQGIQRIAPKAELCIIDDCHHSVHKDQPDILNRALIQFIASVQPSLALHSNNY